MDNLLRSVIPEICILVLGLTGCEPEAPPKSPDYTGQRGTITDIDSNIYKTIGIGTQIWMAENLATTKLNDGSTIAEIKSQSIWERSSAPAYCTYVNDSLDYKNSFGLLYNYYVVKTDLICPIGWHVPSSSEWDILIEFIGGDKLAGGKLKDMRSSLWIGDNYGFSDTCGFNALPGGRRNIFGKFYDLGLSGHWWATQSSEDAYEYLIQNSNTNIWNGNANNTEGFNIRCVKDK